MNGIPVRIVAARLGHAKPSTTSNIYGYAIQSLDEQQVDILESKGIIVTNIA